MSRASGLIAVAAAGLTAAGVARLAYAAANRRPPGGARIWSRTNHRGEAVTLLEGPAVAAGAIAGALAQACLGPARPAAAISLLARLTSSASCSSVRPSRSGTRSH